MSKKKILITGATDGIGLLTAEKLVQAGHHVLVHGRNTEKLAATVAKLKALGKGSVDSFQADLSCFADVEQLARDIIATHTSLDVLINNAGIYKTDSPITDDKLDVRFVVNTLAPYHLTQRLLPLMSSQGRVINLSSAAQAAVDLDAMTGKYTIDDAFNAYAQSKLAITMWTRQMAPALGNKGPVIVAVNPGSLLASKMVTEGFGVAGNDMNIGADILIRAALDDSFANASGRYFDNDAGSFSDPHSAGLSMADCNALVTVMDTLLKQFITV